MRRFVIIQILGRNMQENVEHTESIFIPDEPAGSYVLFQKNLKGLIIVVFIKAKAQAVVSLGKI